MSDELCRFKEEVKEEEEGERQNLMPEWLACKPAPRCLYTAHGPESVNKCSASVYKYLYGLLERLSAYHKHGRARRAARMRTRVRADHADQVKEEEEGERQNLMPEWLTCKPAPRCLQLTAQRV